MIKKQLDKCFKRKRPGLIKSKPNIKHAEDHISKSEWNLKAMKHNFDGKFYDWAIICGYYAMYHASLSALWLIGIQGKDHECVLKALKYYYSEKSKIGKQHLKDFDKAKSMEKKYVKDLIQAKLKRIKVQYETIVVGKKEAEWILKASRRFVMKVETLIAPQKFEKV